MIVVQSLNLNPALLGRAQQQSKAWQKNFIYVISKNVWLSIKSLQIVSKNKFLDWKLLANLFCRKMELKPKSLLACTFLEAIFTLGGKSFFPQK